MSDFWGNRLWKVPVDKIEAAQQQAAAKYQQLADATSQRDQQRAFILQLHLTPVPCPACDFPLNVEAAETA